MTEPSENVAETVPINVGSSEGSSRVHSPEMASRTPRAAKPEDTPPTQQLPSPVSQPSLIEEESNSSQAADESPTIRPGTRGIDYPAFDVSRHGFFGDEDNRVEDSAASILAATPAEPTVPITITATSSNRIPSTAERTATASLLEDILSAFTDRIAAAENAGLDDSSSATRNAPQTATSATSAPRPNTSGSMGSDSSEEARRIIVTVNYIVGENVGLNDGRRGQLVLSVPDVPASQNVQELITFATSVALRAFVTREPPKKGGCTTEEFLQLTVLDQEQLSEEQSLPCSICFEDYEFPTTKKRDLETAEGGGRTKRRKTNNGMPVNTAVSETPVETATGVEKPAKELLSESTIAFEHEPVQLECSHLFGRSCLSEWLKANTTCPLCRHQVVKSSEASAVPVIPPIFVVLPNLSEYYRDVLTQRGGQPNLLVLNGNHQLTRDNIRRLTGLGYLIAVRDDDGSVIRAHLGDVEGTEGNNSDIRSRLFRWSELSRLGRPGTNSSEADRTVDLSVPNTQGTPASAESTAPPSRLGLPRVRQFFDRLIGDIMGGPQRGVGLPGRRLDMLFPGESPTGIPTRPFDMLLPMGVASRRTADGVHTFGFRGENYDEMPRQESAGSSNGNAGTASSDASPDDTAEENETSELL